MTHSWVSHDPVTGDETWPSFVKSLQLPTAPKGRTQKALTEVYHRIQNDNLFAGIQRTYHPADDDGERLPAESKRVHYRAKDAVEDVTTTLTTLFDVVATQDFANCEAKADVGSA